jgi:molybdopterin adenylyltransferase
MIRFGILTISDRSSRGEREDKSGPALVAEVEKAGWQVASTACIPDDTDEIMKSLIAWSDFNDLDVILTTGGTGFTPRDVTPEATLAVIDRQALGLAEAMRAESLKITPHAMLSRAAAGIRGRTLIINLPGSPKAAVESLLVVAPVLNHAVELIRDPSSAESHHKAG